MSREWTDKSNIRVIMEFKDSKLGYLGGYEEHSYLPPEKRFAASIPGKNSTYHPDEASAKRFIEENA